MTNTTIAQAVLEYVPPLICKSLLNKQSFRDEYELTIKALIAFGTSGVSVQRSELFDAVRTVLVGADEARVSDEDGRIWHLLNKADKYVVPILILSSDEQCLSLPDFTVLSNDATLRIRSLEESASYVNLPTDDRENWRLILTERALEDDEVEAFLSDLRDTPVYLEQSVRGEIMSGKSNVSSLVPNSRRYFQRLVGAYEGSNSITDYATRAGRTLFESLSEWRPYEGFLFGLLLSSHSTLTAEITADHLDKDKLVQAYGFVEKHGDMISRLGAFEVGLRILPERPEVEPYLLRLVNRIRNDDADDNASEFKLFSALFVLVDGELSRTRLMAGEPPFYRRLASLAQAALLHRQLVQCGIDFDNFSRWAISNRGEHHYMQSLADMRTEPRWIPDLAVDSQMKANCLGRIMIAGNSFENNICPGELYDTILGNGQQSISNSCEFPHPYFPGPLEGAEVCPTPLPIDLAHVIEQQLDTGEIQASSFFALVNSSMIFRIKSGHAELAAKALRLGNYRLAKLEDKLQLVGILNGLASVAAISRNSSLAGELRILVRRYLRDTEYGISTEEAMRICLVASAAQEELMEWREFAGEWLTELAFSEMEKGEAEVLHSHLIALLHSIPELWFSCARADAALKALCSC